jgi:hypothetical protein
VIENDVFGGKCEMLNILNVLPFTPKVVGVDIMF